MILTINVGKTSVKCKLFNGEKMVKGGAVDRIGYGSVLNHIHAWEKLYQGLSVDASEVHSIAYKLPFSVGKFSKVTKLDKKIIDELKDYGKKIPFFDFASFDVMETVIPIFPRATHFAVFDDCFFGDLNRVAKIYPLSEEVVSKYDFKKLGRHGISHEHSIEKAQLDLGLIRTQRTISVHLGTTCSIAAVLEGRCVDHSGGFSPMVGLMGMTDTGDIDGGLIFYMLKNGADISEVEKILQNESGVKGVSNLSEDMRDVLYIGGFKVDDEKYIPASNMPKKENYIDNARLSIELFTDRVVKYIGAYAAILGGIDTLIFTGAIGSKSAEIRNLILNNLSFIKDFEVLVVEPDEETQMRVMVENFLNSK
ncbi:MAG: hypothetical protein Q7S37_02785 [bacterium]|nr:hypothetical protein [bacterium]